MALPPLPGRSMELVNAQERLTLAGQYLQGETADGKPHEKNLAKAEALLNELLNHNLGSDIILFSLGSMHLERGNHGLAIQLLSQVVQMRPKFGEAWNNLGLAYKVYGDWDKAEYCMIEAIKTVKSPDIPCNIAALNLTRQRAERALTFAGMALELDPDHVKAKWHKGLALLELRRWENAWDYHEARLNGGCPEEIAVRNYHGEGGMTPWWDGKSSGTVVIHGEQGLGDEVMFATCIPDALKTGADFIFECAPRMEAVFKRSFPDVLVSGTHDTDGRRWIGERGKPDFKIPLGSLAKFYRTSAKSFPGTPILVPSPEKRGWWGDKLKALGSRPNIGIAWQGGVPQTRSDVRSLHPGEFAPLFAIDANWISLQYDETAAACVKEVKDTLGITISHWPQAVAQINPGTGKQNDADELVALISKLDLVISVCQTAIHIAGALGIPCLCLTPSQPSWRYGGVADETMPWYASVRLLRQENGSRDWAPVIARAAHEIEQCISIAERRIHAD